MTETIDSELKHHKVVILSKAFSDLGWNTQKEIGQDEIIYFLNKKSKAGQFDINLINKIFQFIGMEGDSKTTVDDFINSFIQFEEELNQNITEFKKKIIKEQNSYNAYQEECYKYKNEKLNSEGFSENAKLLINITDIEIKKKLRNVEKVILYLIYNSQKEELKFEYSNDIITFDGQIYEFKSTSKRDRFELILEGIKNNGDTDIVEIGQKLFPLEEIISQEEYAVQITIPEKGTQDQAAALINSKIILHWSEYKFYEEKKKNSENKLRKLNEASLKINKYLMELKEIYGFSRNKFYTEATQASKEQGFNFDSNFQNNESFSEKHFDDNYQLKKNQQQDQNLRVMNVYDNKDNKQNKFGIGFEEAESGYDKEVNDTIKNRNRNSYKNIKGVWLIKLLSLLCILFGLFNSLQRADYSSALVGMICFWYIYFVDKNNLAVKSKNFWNLFLVVFGALVYDCVWLYANLEFLGALTQTGGDYDNVIKRLSYFTTGCNAIIKCCLAILVFAQYKMNY